MADLAGILDERGSRYGAFISNSRISQSLKEVARDSTNWREGKLPSDVKEAIDMILHKISRVLEGDPMYDDNFVDIAGYAKLVADRLQKI